MLTTTPYLLGAHDGLARALRDREHLAGLAAHKLSAPGRRRPNPEPDPDPNPSLDPNPDPDPDTGPDPEPEPGPEPGPEPDPTLTLKLTLTLTLTLTPNPRRLAAGNALTIRALTICACCYGSGGEARYLVITPVLVENPVDYGYTYYGYTYYCYTYQVLLENPVDYGEPDGHGGLRCVT